MEFSVQHLSFFVIQIDNTDSSSKQYKHYQTLDAQEYLDSEIQSFLAGEFARIAKRKVEKYPSAEQIPTKLGFFIVEPGHDLTSNPNYNLFQRIRFAENSVDFQTHSDELIDTYMNTSAVRGGAFIIVQAKLNQYFDDPFVFVMKCDFEQKIARISDERSLIHQVEMAISARNIKSIMYPYMPEKGVIEESELKIHQASHARYFEDFLKFVSYEKSIPQIVGDQMIGMVHQYLDQKWQGAESEERTQEEQAYEVWAASEKRELQQKWDHEQVMEAAATLVQHKEDLDLKLKLDGIAVKGHLSDYGDKIHIANVNGRYVVLIEGDQFQFEKGMSPVELLQPESIDKIIDRIKKRPRVDSMQPPASMDAEKPFHADNDDDAPWDE
jgi:hypothetical protein